jgi:hypothetical protein
VPVATLSPERLWAILDIVWRTKPTDRVTLVQALIVVLVLAKLHGNPGLRTDSATNRSRFLVVSMSPFGGQ